MYTNKLNEKLKEALAAVLPIVAIVFALAFTIAPMPGDVLLAFLVGAGMLIVGMMFFSLGAELSMEPMGQSIGARLTKTRRLWLIVLTCFALGMMITVSEPDLQVLADQVQSIPRNALIYSVGAGVGLFLGIAVLRMLFSVPLKNMLLISYGLVFILAVFAPDSFLAVAFDSGGVTTGPMTVPFIIAFGVGISAVRSDRAASDDSFGLVSLCSVGPIIAVMILSIIFRPDSAEYSPTLIPEVRHSVELGRLFLNEIPEYIKEIGSALLPIVLFFAAFQMISLRLDRASLTRICVGMLYTYIGLVIFLTGANVGFMPAGSYLGTTLAGLETNIIIIPVGMLIGYFIVKAEPAVYVLMKQVEEITNGGISGKALQRSLSLGVAASVGIAMLRVLTGISVMWFIIPGYAMAFILSFLVPNIFTAVAFDSGGVASGPMTAAFLLPFAMGACIETGGNVVTDAFGVVAMVAMTPLIAIEILGLVYRIKSRGRGAGAQIEIAEDDYEIIEL